MNKYWSENGKQVFKDGSTFEGNFLKGVREGQGKLTHADGTVQEGVWVNGVYQEAVKE